MTNALLVGEVTLTKTDGDTNEMLAGAVFDLQTADGTVVFEKLVTDADGKIFVGDLVPGDYQFVETKAPNGYQKLIAPVTFSITEGALVQTVAIKNYFIKTTESTTDSSTGSSSTSTPEKAPDNKTPLPQTGESDTSLLLVFGGLLLIFLTVLSMFIWRTKQRQ